MVKNNNIFCTIPMSDFAQQLAPELCWGPSQGMNGPGGRSSTANSDAIYQARYLKYYPMVNIQKTIENGHRNSAATTTAYYCI